MNKTITVLQWIRSSILVIVGLAISAAPSMAAETNSTQVPIHIVVDQRVELISIIFRLAGNNEYTQGRVKSYIEDVDKHFGPYRDHPVVKLAAHLRNTAGVSFDAPMSLAIHIGDVPDLRERVPFEPRPEGLDARWQLAEVRDFLEKARAFVKETKFDEFIKVHQPLYDLTALRARIMLEREAHLEWFSQFFGARSGASFSLVPGLVNGGSCYGPHIKLSDHEELYCILGVWQNDSAGLPQFDTNVISIVVHEFNHSYVNPVILAHASEFEAAGKTIYSKVQDRMRRMAYGSWQTMIHESVVRASVVRYVQATKGLQAALRQANEEVDRGFIWTTALSQLLLEYETDRTRYPNLDSFAPRLVEFFNNLSQKISVEEAKPAPLLPAVASNSQFIAKTMDPKELSGASKELAWDDGDATGKQSIGGSGHAVEFEAPGDSWYLTEIRIHGSRYGQASPPQENFHVWLCDSDRKVIADFPFPYSLFERGDEKWVSLPTPPTQVPSKFFLCAGFNPTGSKGVYVSRDSQADGRSFQGIPGRAWGKYNGGDWMIRAVVKEAKPTQR